MVSLFLKKRSNLVLFLVRASLCLLLDFYLMTSRALNNSDDQTDAMYAFCLRFFSELKALGANSVVISPGSRSTPLALSAKSVGLDTSVQLDERVAAFHALGASKISGVPTALICSSGTDAANYLPAIIEANHSQTPMIICTADRPPELRQWGAGQTVNQVGIYGTNVRWSYDLPVVSEVKQDLARSTALRAWSISTGDVKGPVHLNWPFRKPLEPIKDLEAPEPTLTPVITHRNINFDDALLSNLAEQYERGLITVGPNSFPIEEFQNLLMFSANNGWPIIADPCSQIRNIENDMNAPIITSTELLLTSESFLSLLPPAEVIVHVGLHATSKGYRLWKKDNPPIRYVLVSPGVDWPDPASEVTDVVTGHPLRSFPSSSTGRGIGTDWCQLWAQHDMLAVETILKHVTGGKCELSVISRILSSAPSGSSIMLSNSMIVRDADIALQKLKKDISVVSNRGANGIDGVISTGVGVSKAGDGPCLVLVGDVAAAHDVGGLIAAGRLQSDVIIVVIDNGGGAIFSFLPIAEKIDFEIFTDLFTTPHATNLQQVAESVEIESAVIESIPEIEQVLAKAFSSGGPKLFTYVTSIEETVKTYDDIKADFQRSFHEE